MFLAADNAPVRSVPTWSLLLALAVATAQGATKIPDVRDGDIVFHTSRSAQSLAIQRATHSLYSHMGVVLLRGGKPYVFEAISTVQYTPLEQWLARGENGRYVIKRLRKPLTTDEISRLRAEAAPYAGRPYDLTFEWSDTRLYCSELVWKMFQRAVGIEIGHRQRLRDFDLTDPAVRLKMAERYGERVPLDESVISPAAMFAAEVLVEVEAR